MLKHVLIHIIFNQSQVFQHTKNSKLSHCGLAKPYGDMDLGPHWLK